jgi:hypothetical protein
MDHVAVSQSDRPPGRLHPHNKDSKTHRHNLVNKAVYDAVNAQAITSDILGDKGDAAKRDREEALERYAHYSSITRTTYHGTRHHRTKGAAKKERQSSTIETN